MRCIREYVSRSIPEVTLLIIAIQAAQEVEKWRSKLGDIALSTFEQFFQDFPHTLSRNEQRAVWCEAMILQDRLFFEDPEGDETVVSVLSTSS